MHLEHHRLWIGIWGGCFTFTFRGNIFFHHALFRGLVVNTVHYSSRFSSFSRGRKVIPDILFPNFFIMDEEEPRVVVDGGSKGVLSTENTDSAEGLLVENAPDDKGLKGEVGETNFQGEVGSHARRSPPKRNLNVSRILTVLRDWFLG